MHDQRLSRTSLQLTAIQQIFKKLHSKFYKVEHVLAVKLAVSELLE